MESTINIPFPVRIMVDKTGFSYVEDPIEGVSCYAGTESAARKKLRAGLESKLRELADKDRNTKRAFIGCADQTVVLVEYRYGWGYSFFGPGRSLGGSGGTSGFKDFKEALEAAKRHVTEAFGGIAWEN